MTIIFESENFLIEVPRHPHIDRNDGGHIVINPKIKVEDRTQLSVELGHELMTLTMVTGQAMKEVLNRHGIDIGRINYQDNGNWRSEFHYHLYGRAKSATKQPYGEALHFPKPEKGYYEGLEPIHADEIDEIRQEIIRLLGDEKYRSS